MIIYFSGTGNSYAVAKAIGKKYGDQVVPLKRAENDKSKHIIFVFPTYAMDMPPNVKQFVETFPFEKGQQIMGVSVSGGANGSSEASFRKIIHSRGLEVMRFRNFIMTDNSFPILFGNVVEQKEVDVEVLAEQFWTQNKAVQKVKSSGVHTAFSKITFSKTGRKLMKKKVNEDVCIGCGVCEGICPVDNITMKNEKASIGSQCAECFGCIHWCPTQAIRLRKPLKKENQYRHQDISAKELNQ